jgi:acetamidase/formamidase
MQRFRAADHQFSYDAQHAPIGTVQPDEVFQVEAVEGWFEYFKEPSDFTPESYHEAEAHKWAVTGPVSVFGAVPGGAVAVTIHEVEVTGPGISVYGPYAEEDPLLWWDTETAVEIYEVRDGKVLFDDRSALLARPMVGCLAVAPEGEGVHARHQGRYGGNMDLKDLCAGATLVLPVHHPGAGLYFGDCKALMSDGEIVGPPEVAALVTASAVPRSLPDTMRWPRMETAERLTTIVAGNPLEWSARQAFRELADWIASEYEIPRTRAALLMGMTADTGICQVSNDLYTAYCTIPREVLAPYGRVF